MKVSTRGDYASRALLSLALHADESGPTSVRDIAERTGLPQPYLEQILLALKGAGLVRSKRGVGGGYVLAREPGEITLGDIVSAVDGPIAVGDFGEPHQNGACDHEGQCVLLAIWAMVGDHMRRHLDELHPGRHRRHGRGASATGRSSRRPTASTDAPHRSAEAGEDRAEVGGQRRRERQRLAGDRVVEAQLARRAGTAAGTGSDWRSPP